MNERQDPEAANSALSVWKGVFLPRQTCRTNNRFTRQIRRILTVRSRPNSCSSTVPVA